MPNWLSYGGGVNSTALAVLLCQGKITQYEPCRVLFADTGDEKDETYSYIRDYFQPYLSRHGRKLDICYPKETVLERWERLSVTGSRILRSCTVNAKIYPIGFFQKANGSGLQLIGIDAGESHRAKSRPDVIYPLVDMGIDRDGCASIITDAGLPVPVKSGCWHCPFARVREVLELVRKYPCRVERIARLEDAASAKHGGLRTQWRDKTAREWMIRASQGNIFDDDDDPPMPCDCYDG